MDEELLIMQDWGKVVHFMTVSKILEYLIQRALDNKTSADGGEQARKWAIVRTELEKIHAYVLTLDVSLEN